MRKLVSLLLSVLCVTTFAQERPDMVPEMTEIWDPEVSVVAPGESPMDAPSDAIVLLELIRLLIMNGPMVKAESRAGTSTREWQP